MKMSLASNPVVFNRNPALAQGPEGGYSIGFSGNIALLGGWNLSLGIVVDYGGYYQYFISTCPSIGLDASAGFFSKGIYPTDYERGFYASDYAGYGRSHNIGLGFTDWTIGGNNLEDSFFSQTYNNYYEVGSGASVGSPLAYTHQFSHTWTFWGGKQGE